MQQFIHVKDEFIINFDEVIYIRKSERLIIEIIFKNTVNEPMMRIEYDSEKERDAMFEDIYERMK